MNRSMPNANGHAGAPGHYAATGSEPDADDHNANKGAHQGPVKGAKTTSRSGGTARAQAIVRIGERRRIGTIGRRDPRSMNLAKVLPAANMGDRPSTPAPIVTGPSPQTLGGAAHLGTSLPAHVRAR